MFENLKLVLRSYTSLYGIFMSASLTLFMLGLHYVNVARRGVLVIFAFVFKFC